jgi:phosphatidylglycerol:prolipoprotein diacylglycerol transferase
LFEPTLPSFLAQTKIEEAIMYPFVSISLFGSTTLVSTSLVLDFLCLLSAPFLFKFFLGSTLSFRKILLLVVGTFLGAWIGARLFHVIWERPDYFRAHPSEIFTSFTGMTFYGALALGSLVFFGLSRLYVFPQNRARVLDVGAILGALFYGILRIGCFADGCCWGRLCRYPWAVRYFNPESEMPYLGLPVHPVQLYDSFAGFVIAGILFSVSRSEFYRKNELQGSLVWMFFGLYSIARTLTESFRGDAYRGVDLLFGMSTSQLISSALLIFSMFIISLRIKMTQQSRLGTVHA